MKPVKVLNGVACALFIASLFLPMENHAAAGPCNWPCAEPFTYTVFNNSFVFILSPLFVLFHLLAWDGLEAFSIFAVYSLIGMGEILLLLTPVLENQINSRFRQILHLLLTLPAAVAILAYGLISDVRLGIDPLRIGYYCFALSLLLAAVSSVLRYRNRRVEESFLLQV